MGFEEVRGEGEATEDHGPISLRSKLKVTRKFRDSSMDSSHVDEATLAYTVQYFGAFLFCYCQALPGPLPLALYSTAVVVKNTRMQAPKPKGNGRRDASDSFFSAPAH